METSDAESEEWEVVRFGEAQSFHFQGLRMEEILGDRTRDIEDSFQRHLKQSPAEYLISNFSPWAICFGITAEAEERHRFLGASSSP